jgi:tetratricopeptide (TPR) repeat protein
MSYPISVYATISGQKIECNVIAFFRSAASVKLYVVIKSPIDEKSNSIIPFIVNNDEIEQEPILIEENYDKSVVEEYCKENFKDIHIEFLPDQKTSFSATLDLDSIKMHEVLHNIQLQEMLRQKQELNVDKVIEQIDIRIVDLSLDELNENAPDSAIEFIKNCVKVTRYELWLNKKIEEAKNKISKFSNSEIFSSEINQLKVLQSLIILLTENVKEWKSIEDALVTFVDYLGEDKSSVSAIINNETIRSVLPENERKRLYSTIVFRTNKNFDTKTVNAVANYFYKEKEYAKSAKLFISLKEQHEESPDIDGEQVEIYNSIGCCYVGLMQFEEAYHAFRQATEINPDYAVAYNNWAYALAVECDVIPKDNKRELKLQEALRRINQAIQHKNDDISFYSNKACIDYELNNFKAVIEDYNDGKRVSSRYKDIETLLKLKIHAQIELYYTNQEHFSFDSFVNDLEAIYKNNVGSNKYLFGALEVYHKIRDHAENADKISLKLLVFEFVVDKLMSALAIRDLDQKIYYYTSLSSLQRILEDDEFRQPIFCANHMNDPNEGQELHKMLVQQISNIELLQDLFEKQTNSPAQKRRHELNIEFTFLKAFTENDDALPMWIHYGDKGKGCCVKVNPKFFSNFDNDSDSEEKTLGNKPFDDEYRLYRVLYLQDGLLPINTDLEIKQLYEEFIKLFADLGLQYINYNLETRKAVSNSILKMINSIKYLFKNTDYQYEREMRIVLRRSMSDFERGDLDIQMTKPTENNHIPKVFIYTKKPLEIEEVILGPKIAETNEVIPYIAMRLLKLNDYHEEKVSIAKSVIEYR